ncbi:hypothetical protein ACFDR9_005526 [Janthinobacterium sp. CG_23.3]
MGNKKSASQTFYRHVFALAVRERKLQGFGNTAVPAPAA